MTQAELLINVTVSPELLPSPYSQLMKEGGDEKETKQSTMCKISIELTSYTTLHDIQVVVDVDKPLAVTNDSVNLANLCKEIRFFSATISLFFIILLFICLVFLFYWST